jgi:hypothetical protein
LRFRYGYRHRFRLAPFIQQDSAHVGHTGTGLPPCKLSFRSAPRNCKLPPNRRIREGSSIRNAERKLGGEAEASTPQGIQQKVCGIGPLSPAFFR